MIEPKKAENARVKTSQSERPITIKQVLENDIKPPKEEYGQLKDLDARMNVLKFSTDIAKKYSGYKRANVTTLSLNRYFQLK